MDMEHTSISRLLLKLSPPVMLALLIQSIYNIVDSYFIGSYSGSGLTALSLIYPIQLLMTAIGTGTGAGVNILIARQDGLGETSKQMHIMKTGLILSILYWLIFSGLSFTLTSYYFHIFSDTVAVQLEGIWYTRIIFCASLGLFVESICTKILQARGNMTIPMIAQVTGACINVILDPILIFGLLGAPELGIAGAAIATVLGQWVAMCITLIPVIKQQALSGHVSLHVCCDIYKNGVGSIITQALYTLYILGLNMILKSFTEDAVTVLGIYYKIQSFFFIPLMGFQQVLLPVISYNFGAGNLSRTKEALHFAEILSCILMTAATVIFFFFPEQLIGIFSSKEEILGIGQYALKVIGLSFIPAGLTIATTAYLQGIARIRSSIFVIIMRQVILLVPLAWLLHFHGLRAVWWTFPLTEFIVSVLGIILSKHFSI